MSAVWKTAGAHAIRHRKKENTNLEKLIRFSPEKLLISRGSFSPLSTLTLARFSFVLPFSVSSLFSSRRQRRNETKRHSAAHETLDTKPSGTKATACSTRKRRHRSIGLAFFAERFQRPRAWPVDDEETEIPRLTGRTGRFLERTHGHCAKADLSATKGVRLGRARASWHSAKWHETLLGRSIQFETFPRSIRVLRFATASL